MNKPKKKINLAFSGKNYKLMLFGLAILITGFFIMTLDKEDYGFGFLGITLGPIIVMVGFGIQFWAILHAQKQNKD
ncbi:MAG: DUF3098 domain-containing protein [Bacteroidetes bacterium]|nr:DUF3098 domain-containing protein [Bacteroidota bacterium]